MIALAFFFFLSLLSYNSFFLLFLPRSSQSAHLAGLSKYLTPLLLGCCLYNKLCNQWSLRQLINHTLYISIIFLDSNNIGRLPTTKLPSVPRLKCIKEILHAPILYLQLLFHPTLYATFHVVYLHNKCSQLSNYLCPCSLLNYHNTRGHASWPRWHGLNWR